MAKSQERRNNNYRVGRSPGATDPVDPEGDKLSGPPRKGVNGQAAETLPEVADQQ